MSRCEYLAKSEAQLSHLARHKRALALPLLWCSCMHLSRFVLTYRDVRPGEHVLYDVIKDHYVGVDEATLQAIERWKNAPPAGEDEATAQQVLTDEGILVRESAEDDGRLRGFLEAAAEGMPGTMYVTLMPTLACNLACNYCFQKDHPAFTKMKERIESATVEWILRKVDAAASRRLLVHYFGGEPLTRKDYLLRTAEIFSTSMLARGAAFEWEMTTSGIGLTVEFVRAMLAHGPGSIKITLDGDKETHDAARVYRNGKGTFDEIFANTVAVAKGCRELKLRIGGNFRPEQVESYERLLDRLEEAGLGGLIDTIRFKPVIDTGPSECGTCTSCATGSTETATLGQLRESIEQRGIARVAGTGKPPSSPCELHWKNSYVIDPEGRVYKCPAVAGRPEMAVGTVGQFEERIAPLVELRPWEQCGPCPFMPVCVGGCLGGKYLQTGRRDEVFCRKPFFEDAFRSDVVNRYLAEFGDAVTGDAASRRSQYQEVSP
jgi:uncharacterized protein